MLKRVGTQRPGDGSPVVFELPEPLAPGDRIELEAEVRAFFDYPAALKGNHQCSLTDWYPKLWWDYQTHADYRVSLEVPSTHVITTSARRRGGQDRWIGKNIRSFALVIGEKDHLNLLEHETGGVLIQVARLCR